MALTHDLLKPSIGIPVVGAYTRISGVFIQRNDSVGTVEKEKFHVMVDTSTYAVQPEHGTIPQTIESKRRHVALAAIDDRFIAALYRWLKNQPEFSDATDA